jgi:hypothetical protein
MTLEGDYVQDMERVEPSKTAYCDPWLGTVIFKTEGVEFFVIM